MPDPIEEPDQEQALARYRSLAGSYDRSLSILLAAPVRRRAVQRLAPTPGEAILDIACGTGLNLPLLQAGVGPFGKVIGVEMSPEMISIAGARVEAEGLGSVQLQQAPVEELRLSAPADGALLSFTHDVLRSEAAAARISEALKPGGRAVAAGIMDPWLRAGRPVIRAAARRYVTTLEGLAKPWSLLAGHLEVQTVERLRVYAGSMFVVTLRKRG